MRGEREGKWSKHICPGMPASGRRVDEGGPAERWVEPAQGGWPRGVWAGGRLSAEGGSGLPHRPPGRGMRKQVTFADLKVSCVGLKEGHRARSNQKAKRRRPGGS